MSKEYTRKILNLKTPESSTDEDERLDLLIDWITERAKGIIGRDLEKKERTELLDGAGGTVIILPVIPVEEVKSISLDAQRNFQASIEPEEFTVNKETGVIELHNHVSPVGSKTIKVVYTAGWEQDDVPADLKMAAIEAISWNLSRLHDRQFGIKSQTTPDGVNLGYEMVLPLGAQKIFESYRDVRL